MKFLLAKKLILLTVLGHASATADAWTTRQLLIRHGHDASPAYEINPLLRTFSNGPQVYGAVQTDVLAGDILLARWKHRRLAAGIMVGIIALHSAAAVHNATHQAALQRQPFDPASRR
jgi:putative copper export protein